MSDKLRVPTRPLRLCGKSDLSAAPPPDGLTIDERRLLIFDVEESSAPICGSDAAHKDGNHRSSNSRGLISSSPQSKIQNQQSSIVNPPLPGGAPTAGGSSQCAAKSQPEPSRPVSSPAQTFPPHYPRPRRCRPTFHTSRLRVPLRLCGKSKSRRVGLRPTRIARKSRAAPQID